VPRRPQVDELTLRAGQLTLSQLLDHQTEYHIPTYQRDYTWDVETVEVFLDDVTNAHQWGSQRFFGTLLFSKNAPSQSRRQHQLWVVDGQQRLITSLLVISALTHLAREVGNPSAAELAGEYQGLLNPQGGRRDRCRLHATRGNADFVRFLLTDRSLTRQSVAQKRIEMNPVDRKSIRSIYDAYQKISTYLLSRVCRDVLKLDIDVKDFASKTITELVVESGGDKQEVTKSIEIFIEEVASHFLNHSVFVRIDIDSWEESFQLFDGLNNRGLELAQKDILKNLMLERVAKAKTNEGTALRRWQEVEAALEKTSFDNFLRHWLLLTKPDVSLRRATEIFISSTEDEQPLETLNDMLTAARHYKYFESPSEHADKQVTQGLESLRLMSATRIRPIILAALLKNVRLSRLRQLIVATENLYFRRSTICQQDNKSLEREVQEIAFEIFAKGDAYIDEAITRIGRAGPSQEQFRVMFENKSGLKSAVARYLLLKIENHLKFSTQSGSDLVVAGGQLEHIYPQNPGDGWTRSQAFEEDELTNRIGNLTIIAQRENLWCTNSEFAVKRGVYDLPNEKLRINRDVLASSEWGKAQIVARQAALAEQALVVWPPTLQP
jgi:hypothetical protein